jgi:S1-C subfamily serine protease
LIANDIITHVDSRAVANSDQVRSVVSSKRPGEIVALDVWRLNEATGAAAELDLVVTLSLLDAEVRTPEAVELVHRLGLLELATSTKARAADLGVPYRRGVIIETIAPASLYAAQVRPGAVILTVEGRFVTNVDEFYHLLDQGLFTSQQARLSRPRLQIGVINPDGDEQEIIISRDNEPSRRD